MQVTIQQQCKSLKIFTKSLPCPVLTLPRPYPAPALPCPALTLSGLTLPRSYPVPPLLPRPYPDYVVDELRRYTGRLVGGRLVPL